MSRRALATADWRTVPCDLCGSAALETLGERSHRIRGRTRDHEMTFTDALCRACGFVCAAKRPDEAFLMAYYRDAHVGHRGGELHFNADARIGTVARYAPPGGRVIEIGANDGAFTALLREAGFDAFGFDPVEADEAAAVTKGYLGADETAPAPGEADAAVAYYVLEHVTDPRAWLCEVARLVKSGGFVILEVPNYETHPEDSLNLEHLLHFTPESLARLARQCGLEPVEAGAGTVAYGQSLVARKREHVAPSLADPGAQDRARAAYEAARKAREARADAARRATQLAADAAETAETPVYLWGANEYAERAAPMLTAHFKTVQVLDKSPSKIGGEFANLPAPVAHPDDTTAVQGAIFLVCSPNWNRQIAEEIGRRANPALAVIDAVTGERL